MAMLARPSVPAIVGRAPWPDRSALLAAATVAVAGELLVQRVLVRIAVHIPGAPVLRRPYELVSAVGSALFTAAVLLVLLALALTAWRLARRLRTSSAAVVLGALGAFPLAGVLAGVAGATSGLEVPLALLDALALTVLGVLCARGSRRGLRLPGLLVSAGLLLGVASAISAALGLGGTLPLATAGEVVLLIGAIVAPIALLRGAAIRRSEALIAAAAAAAILLLQAANPATTGILMLWGLGLTGALFAPLYWAAAGAIALVIVVLMRQHRVAMAIALLLIAMGGYGLHNTYQSTVQLLGLALLVDAFAVDAPPIASSPVAQTERSAL